MTLEQWFYIFGSLFFASWIIFLLVVIITLYMLTQKMKIIQQEAELKIASVKSSLQRVPFFKINSVGAALPIASWIMKQVMNRRHR